MKRCKSVLAVAGAAVALAQMAHGQGGFEPQGAEYSIAGELTGDQVYARMSLNPGGGYLVWQDNHTDGQGAGISAVRLDSSGTTSYDVFRVNTIAAGDQEHPTVVGLNGGNQLFVWQGGDVASQEIYVRVVGTDGVFVNPAEHQVSSDAGNTKVDPAAAALSGGDAVVVWSSYGQDDSSNPNAALRGLRGVYGRIVSETGEPISEEFLVNETVEFGQRTPSVAGLSDDRFIVVWATEQVIGSGDSQAVSDVNIMGRFFSSTTAQPLGSEFQISTSTNICANPSVVATQDGGFSVVWSEREPQNRENSWDISLRRFDDASPQSGSAVVTVNAHTYGDQFYPHITGTGTEQLVVWTSMGQDGSYKGVFGRFASGGQVVGDEFQINTQTASDQELPAVGAFGDSSMLVVWSSFVGGEGGVDLMAQRYSVTIPRPGAPIISASSSYELFVAWPEVAGFEVDEYLLYVDGQADPLVTTEIFQQISGLNPGSSHVFRLAYKLADGRVSPLSDEVVGVTFGADLNFDGLPDDWQAAQFGSDQSTWDGPLVDTDGDGVNNLNEFLAGTRASDVNDVLRMSIVATSQGWQLVWNSVPGLVYKVSASVDLGNWSDVSGYRFSAGSADSMFVQPGDAMEYYRVVRIR